MHLLTKTFLFYIHSWEKVHFVGKLFSTQIKITMIYSGAVIFMYFEWFLWHKFCSVKYHVTGGFKSWSLELLRCDSEVTKVYFILIFTSSWFSFFKNINQGCCYKAKWKVKKNGKWNGRENGMFFWNDVYFIKVSKTNLDCNHFISTLKDCDYAMSASDDITLIHDWI